MNIFNFSLNAGIFPDKTKVVKLPQSLKKAENLAFQYRPMSVLPCFSKILERIMYNRLYDYLTVNNILFHKQFRFRSGHSTEQALLELIDQICDLVNDTNYFLVIFILFY